MNSEIIRRRVSASYQQLAAELHPVLARIYAARNVEHAEEVAYSLDKLPPYHSLRNIEAAARLLHDAVTRQQRILIVADFDADGATSCALAIRALNMMGAKQVDFLVPNRFEFGYGLTPEIVAIAATRLPELLVTVDNGISSIEGVAAARAFGMRVLVTDHHLPGAQLPEADAIVNPNLPGDAFPSKALAGVGVIFYVMLAVRAQLRASGWFAQQEIPEPNLAHLLDLVALGTVADVVPLDYTNRILVAQGLARIRKGACCAGIAALLRIAGRRLERVAASDLGFAVGPRLNAAGRLEDMSLGICCLLSNDAERVERMVRELNDLNAQRREIEQEMQLQAHELLNNMRLDEARLPVGLCLFDETWHQGVIGILASRIKDKTHRPVIAFALAEKEDEVKGSARSVVGVHIRDVLEAVATAHPGMLTRFGGHAMAAGLSLPREHLAAFMDAFDREVRRHLSEDALRGMIHSDGELRPHEFDLELARLLRDAGPWGQGFPEPVFEGVFMLEDRRIVGEKHLKLRLRSSDAAAVDAIAFNTTDAGWPLEVRQVSVAYQLDVNEYNGRESVQLLVRHIHPHE
ncbi:MAG: single-stranded-DNA-specific exonuclease RecJ [Pseudomonadota bacterium]